MVGREISNIYGSRKSEDRISDQYFEVKNLRVEGKFRDINFSLRKGEILGISGLVGAGRTEMGMTIFGAYKPDCGEVWLEGVKQNINSPSDAINNKIAYLTEDRKAQGLFLNMTIQDNFIAPDTKTYSSKIIKFFDKKKAAAAVDKAIKTMKIATPSIFQRVNNLSGGNQQKVLLSMWLGIHPKVLIVDEPTRGVDVGAKSDIYQLLRNMASSGLGIIVISSDLMELLGISDRLLVMRQGQIVGEMDIRDASEEKVVAIASGLHTSTNNE
jgi:ABC-type sugar transport system ATPase subunit